MNKRMWNEWKAAGTRLVDSLRNESGGRRFVRLGILVVLLVLPGSFIVLPLFVRYGRQESWERGLAALRRFLWKAGDWQRQAFSTVRQVGSRAASPSTGNAPSC